MLNYIWTGLIAFSLLFALLNDAHDVLKNTFGNGIPHSVELQLPPGFQQMDKQEVQLSADGQTLRATWRWNDGKPSLDVSELHALPPHWKKVDAHRANRSKTPLRLQVTQMDFPHLQVLLPEVHFVKLRAITDAAFDMAETAVKLAIGLMGAMALWLGMMRIAEQSGLIHHVVRWVYPVLRRLFPSVPKDHPAFGAISMNIAANMLGLGNAATPLGIKAMEELQKLAPDKETATDAMCMFLTMNTASVQLVPPVTLIALMGVGVSELFFSIILATLISLTVGIITAKLLAKKWQRKEALA